MPIRSSLQTLQAYVPGEQPSGDRVLKLNTNENAYPPSPKVFEALGGITADTLRTYPNPIGRDLCGAIADLHGLEPGQVLVTNGSDEGLALCTRAFCEHGGRAGYLTPSYSLYPVLSVIAGLERVEYELSADFQWEIPESVDVDLFFLTQPNAPTGLAMSRKQIETLLQRCPGILLIDEAYVDFADESMLPLLHENDRVLISRSFSKSYSLAGIRMGYLLGSRPLIGALYKIKDSYNTDVLAQRAAMAALRDQSTMLSNVTAIRGTRVRVSKELTKRGFRVLPSQTNFVFAKVPAGKNAETLFHALRDRQVFVRYFPGKLTGDYLRVTIGTDDQMDRFLAELDQVLGN